MGLFQMNQSFLKIFKVLFLPWKLIPASSLCQSDSKVGSIFFCYTEIMQFYALQSHGATQTLRHLLK